jgi:glucose/arabinose dehydrogenase
MKKDLGNSLETATRIKLSGSRQVLRNAIGGGDREDYSLLKLTNRSRVFLTVDKLKSNVDLQLLDRQGALLQGSTRKGKRSETIVRDLDPGTYYIRCFTNQGKTNYRMVLSTGVADPAVPPGPEDCGCGIPTAPVPKPLASLPNLRLTQTATGLMEPTAIANAGDGSNRLFVTEKKGRIQILENGKPKATPFLDISDRVSSENEQGLLSVAFPSGYASKRSFYASYANKAGDLVISRFQTSSDPNVALPASEQILLTIPHRDAKNHYGGQLVFDAQGYLYIATGDGGSRSAAANAQDSKSLLGKILRIDVESGAGYTVPSSNPFTAQTDPQNNVLDEIWASGLRNPWRMSIDPATGNLYIADVGQDRYEEINIQPGSLGGQNYGWNKLEGNLPYPAGSTGNYAGLTPPAFVYDHSQGDKSVTGGYVYRGTAIPGLQGAYIYGDFISGKVWGLRQTATGGWNNQFLLDTPNLISTFGQDEQGNLYLTDYFGQAGTGTDGVIYKIDAA